MIIGVAIGIGICLLQEKFGIVKLPGASQNFVVEAYPVRVMLGDVIAILAIVLCIGFITAYYPVRKIAKTKIQA